MAPSNERPFRPFCDHYLTQPTVCRRPASPHSTLSGGPTSFIAWAANLFAASSSVGGLVNGMDWGEHTPDLPGQTLPGLNRRPGPGISVTIHLRMTFRSQSCRRPVKRAAPHPETWNVAVQGNGIRRKLMKENCHVWRRCPRSISSIFLRERGRSFPEDREQRGDSEEVAAGYSRLFSPYPDAQVSKVGKCRLRILWWSGADGAGISHPWTALRGTSKNTYAGGTSVRAGTLEANTTGGSSTGTGLAPTRWARQSLTAVPSRT
jgi:autotransporter-associated beta strand protein